MENRLASRIHEQARPGLRDALEDLERVHLRFDDRQPRRTTLLERREHSRPYLLPELGSLAAGSNAARPHEMRRTPRCNLKLHAFSAARSIRSRSATGTMTSSGIGFGTVWTRSTSTVASFFATATSLPLAR